MKDQFADAENQYQSKVGIGLGVIIVAIVLIVIIGLNVVKQGKVEGNQVGILLNKLNGNIKVIDQSGVTFYNGITNNFYTLEKTIQTLEMTENVNKGERSGKDDLKVKTIDGSDVYVDLTIQYKIIPSMADVVVRTSGLGDNFKLKWVRDYARSVCRNFLGELTTEEFYDATKRTNKTENAKGVINSKIKKNFGIEITNIIMPQKPHFYDKYEEMIKKKKYADQAVLQEKSKALEASEKQKTMIVEIENKRNVAVEKFSGEMEEKLIAAKAAGEKARQAADAYYDKTTIGAGATLYRKTAEAKGIEKMKEALEGEGGKNMVKMEYAKKLKQVKITGKPFFINGNIEKFEVDNAAVTSRRNNNNKGRK